ncbi:MAG: FAD-dependent oxidoreductase [Planctomycetia bacterium]|nr:FAD-dependent oxidoreductase [Planctomycetia bacterium]
MDAVNSQRSNHEELVIVGSGPAGWTAALYSARASLRPLVFEGAFSPENQDAGLLPMGQLTTTGDIENYPGFPKGDARTYIQTALDPERVAVLPYDTFDDSRANAAISGAVLVELMRRQAVNFGARVVSEDVVRVDFRTRPFKLWDSQGELTEAHAVIIASGASARWLELDSEERYKGRGVSACAVCDAAAPRFFQQPLAVVGGGDSAVEEALYLTRFASRVYLIHRRDVLRASPILTQRALNSEKIVPVWNRVVREVLGDEQRGVTAVTLCDPKEPGVQERLDVAGVFVAIGRRPNVAFLDGALELDAQGYIKRIGWSAATSVPGVFVAGDVADPVYRQAVIAAGSGAMAALDAQRFLNELER